MQMMRNSPQQLVVKMLGTVVLAAAFILLVARTPFLHQPSTDKGPIASVRQQQASGLGDITLDTDILGTSSAQSPTLDAVTGRAPSLGLFAAHYGSSVMDTGFSTREQRLAGKCAGAGRRYIQQVCPDCQIMSGGPQAAQAEMLMWTSGEPGSEVVAAVGANCSSVSADGYAIVDMLQFGSGPINLEQQRTDLKLDTVPLLPGSDRIGAFEVGEWLATIDAVSHPNTALNDMSRELKKRGWREASSTEANDVRMFEQQRVFINAADALCVVTLNREGDSVQLLTIVSSQARG